MHNTNCILYYRVSNCLREQHQHMIHEAGFHGQITTYNALVQQHKFQSHQISALFTLQNLFLISNMGLTSFLAPKMEGQFYFIQQILH